MDLKNIVEGLYNDSERTPPRGLGAIAETEKYLQQAYEGRYFFELIQNVRDANKEIEQDGEILIQLTNNILSISNTGVDFSAKGVEGITTISHPHVAIFCETIPVLLNKSINFYPCQGLSSKLAISLTILVFELRYLTHNG
jgi:hypothetical protein